MVFLVVSAACLLASASPAVTLCVSRIRWLAAGRARAAPTAAGLHALAVASGATSDETQGTAYFEFLKGRQLESLGQPVEALAAYERASKLEPASAQIRAEIAGAPRPQQPAGRSHRRGADRAQAG